MDDEGIIIEGNEERSISKGNDRVWCIKRNKTVFSVTLRNCIIVHVWKNYIIMGKRPKKRLLLILLRNILESMVDMHNSICFIMLEMGKNKGKFEKNMKIKKKGCNNWKKCYYI